MSLSLLRKVGLSAALSVMLVVGTVPRPAAAAPLSLADSPIFLLTSVDPNIIFTYDDSGSMAWGYMPDIIDDGPVPNDVRLTGLRDQPRGCAANINGIYYDPNTQYDAPVKADGTPLNTVPTSFTAAYRDGFTTASGTVNLSSNYRPSWAGLTSYSTCFAACSNKTGSTFSNQVNNCNNSAADVAAFYFVYDATLAGCNPASVDNDACYRQVTVSATSGPGGTDEQQNFANWYSYHRTRTLVAKTGAGKVFQRLSDTLRIAYQRLNSCNAGLGGAPTAACPGSSVRPFTTAAKTTFLTWLYGSPASGTTPLRSAFQRAGQYLSTTSANSPWAQNPGTSVGMEYECRQNFHVAFTDGLWNNDNPTVAGDADNSSVTLPAYDLTAERLKLNYHPGSYSTGSLPAGRQVYPGTASPNNPNNLGDIAFYYWSRDARPTLLNKVSQYILPNTGNTDAEKFWHPDNDPATWQHLVNYTVGLGVTGTLIPANYFDRSLSNSAGDWDELMAGTKTWGSTTDDSINNVDDLWHAAVNSRGRYFSARNAKQLVESLQQALDDATARSGSSSSLSANAGSVGSNTLIYQAKFNSSDWSGRLYAFGIDPGNNTVNTSPTWDAGVQLNGLNFNNGRKIITYNTDASVRDGTKFRWTNSDLSAAQQQALNINPSTAASDGKGAERLDYLRGASANEGQGLNFRVRTCLNLAGQSVPCTADVGKLGDIINSSPIYVGRPPFRYRDSLETTPYSSFANKTEVANRTPIVYVGANDGMLHGFNANTGAEEIAYVPSPVYTNLSRLTGQSYSHRYFVDGSPMVGDVFIDKGNGKEWRTVLVGGLNKGGRGYFALDVTDPGKFKEDNAADLVLWEFTEANDADLGYSFSQPSIVKMANGKWAAIFGNGYNNVSPGSGKGFIYILFIERGVDGTWTLNTDYVKLATDKGDATTPNGIAGVTAVDVNRDEIVDYIYAGDLEGNLWRFDVSNPQNLNESGWITAIQDTSASAKRRTLLFKTKTGQPITQYPAVTRHPLGGLLVYFGTGKYLESSDNNVSGATTQTFYAIWDRGLGETVTNTNLLQQTVDSTSNKGGFDVRLTSNNSVKWATAATPAAGTHLGWYMDLPTQGERSVNPALVREGKIIFSTTIPASVPCEPGNDGWLMELDGFTGGRLPDTFDLNGNGSIDDGDLVSGGGGGGGGGGGIGDIAASGVKTGGGSGVTILSTNPNLANPPRPAEECVEVKLANTSEGKIVRMEEKCRGPSRESWMQPR
jgi:type IV pilus assembly protein PilY1